MGLERVRACGVAARAKPGKKKRDAIPLRREIIGQSIQRNPAWRGTLHKQQRRRCARGQKQRSRAQSGPPLNLLYLLRRQKVAVLRRAARLSRT